MVRTVPICDDHGVITPHRPNLRYLIVLGVISLGGGWAALSGTAVAAAPAGSVAPAAEYHGECPTAAATLARGVVLSCGRYTNPSDPPPTTSTSTAPPTTTAPAGNTSTTHVITADLSAGGVTVAAVQANNVLFQPLTPLNATDQVVSDLAQGDVNTGRAQAVAGINGGYFDNNKNTGNNYTGQPCAGIVSNGIIYKSPAAGYQPTLAVHTGGYLSIGPVEFVGRITDGSTTNPLNSHLLASVNNLADAGPQPTCPKALDSDHLPGSGITLLTPQLGRQQLPGSSDTTNPQDNYWIPNAVLILGHHVGQDTVVDQVQTQFASCVPGDTATTTTFCTLPNLNPTQVGLLGSIGTTGQYGGRWLQDTIKVGDHLDIQAHLADPTITDIVSGGTQLIRNGAPTAYPFGGYPPGNSNAETVVGLSADGRTLTMAVIDKDIAAGVSVPSAGVTVEQAQAFAQTELHAYNAIMLDGGGSSTMVAAVPQQCPGSGPVGVVNDTYTGENQYPPGVCNQRYVGNGLFLYAARTSRAPSSTATTSRSPSTTTGTTLPGLGAPRITPVSTTKSSTPRGGTTTARRTSTAQVAPRSEDSLSNSTNNSGVLATAAAAPGLANTGPPDLAPLAAAAVLSVTLGTGLLLGQRRRTHRHPRTGP